MKISLFARSEFLNISEFEQEVNDWLQDSVQNIDVVSIALQGDVIMVVYNER